MDKIWILAALLLDSVPFNYFMLYPLKKDLRFTYKHPLPVWTLASVLSAVFSFSFSLLPFYVDKMFLLLRLLNLSITFILVITSVKKAKAKATFVFSLLVPFSTGLTVIAAYIAQFIPISAPKYMFSSLIRLGFIIVLYPVTMWLWGKIHKEAIRITDNTVWKYLWLIPASSSISELVLMSDLYTRQISFSDMLGRVFLWIGSIAVCWLVFFLAGRFELRIHLQDINERNELLLSLQEQQYIELAENIQKTRAARHDLRHHLNALKVMAENGEYDKLSEYITDIVGSLPTEISIKICENYAANALISHYIKKAKELEIPIKVNFRLNNKSGISDADLCVLLGNTVENAIEATSALPPEKRFVSISAIDEEERIYMTFDNSFDGVARQSDSGYLSRKRDFLVTGVGMSSINMIVKKYNGDMKIETEDGVFRLSVMLTKNAI